MTLVIGEFGALHAPRFTFHRTKTAAPSFDSRWVPDSFIDGDIDADVTA